MYKKMFQNLNTPIFLGVENLIFYQIHKSTPYFKSETKND